MKKILLDTSIIIDFLRKKEKEKTLFFSLIKANFESFISIITHTELYAGKSVWESKNAQQELEILFSGLKILPLEVQISEIAGQIRVKYDVNLLDAIIAATALVHDIELATFNVRDFKRIKGVKLFRN